jgi:hypothetical protein
MSGKFIVLVVAAIGWLIAAVFAFAFVTLFGFAGVAFYGLLLLFICMQVELDPDGSARAPRQNMSRAERIMTAIMTTRFFKYVGIGLTLVGLGGFLYFQLDLFATIPSAVKGD